MRSRLRFRPALLLAAALLMAVAWVAREQSRAKQQDRVLSALYRSNILVLLEEPTAVGQLVRKVAPRREDWLRERIGARWLAVPTVLRSDDLIDSRVPHVVDGIDQLGTVREIHLHDPRLPSAGRDDLSRRLPDVNLALASERAQQTYYRSRTEHAQLQSEA